MKKKTHRKTKKEKLNVLKRMAIPYFELRRKLVRPHLFMHSHFSWYKRWHKFKYHKHVHIAHLSLFIIYTILTVISTVTMPKQTFAALVQSTKTTTSQSEYQNGSLSNTEITNTTGGEIQLSGGGGTNWWDPSWQRRIPITITNTGLAQTDYQVKITVPYDTDMLANFDDLRFANSSGAPLSFWLQSKTDSTQATVWVKVDSLTASANTTIYMYYGNSSVTSGSNGNATFILFDNFDDGVLDTNKWVEADPSSRISETGGKLVFDSLGSYLGWDNTVYAKNAIPRSDLSFEMGL